MTKHLHGEQWKTIKFDVECINKGRTEISNYGRLRTFNKMSDGNIINGSMINGYKIIRIKLFKPREEKVQKKIDRIQQQVYIIARKLKSLKDNKESKKIITETEKELEQRKADLSKICKDDFDARAIHYHSLIHRLVADYFLKKPSAKHTIVAHLDYDKLNNRTSNLKWMMPEENYEHQKGSPYVIKEKLEREKGLRVNRGVMKLTTTKVMLMKKLINEGKENKQLVKIFKVSETQIIRIRKGENWGGVEAAK
jgi:hypothetical protein